MEIPRLFSLDCHGRQLITAWPSHQMVIGQSSVSHQIINWLINGNSTTVLTWLPRQPMDYRMTKYLLMFSYKLPYVIYVRVTATIYWLRMGWALLYCSTYQGSIASYIEPIKYQRNHWGVKQPSLFTLLLPERIYNPITAMGFSAKPERITTPIMEMGMLAMFTS